MSPPSGYNPLPIFMVQNRICRLRVHKDWSWSSPPAKEVRHATRDVASLSQGIRRLCGELMLLQKAVLEARGLKPNLFDNLTVGRE